VQAGFSVPKKKFRSSVHRHRIRRLMVEAWRHQKHLLYAVIPPEQMLHVFVIYSDAKMPDLEAVSLAMAKGIEKLKATFPTTTPE